MAYPKLNFRFKVEIEGLQVAKFSEVTGIDMTFDVIEYRNGADAMTPSKQPGLVKYSNVVLKRGVVEASEAAGLYNWLKEIKQGTLTRKTIVISMADRDDDMSATSSPCWTLYHAWPCKYTGPDLNAMGSEVAVESIELAYEDLLLED